MITSVTYKNLRGKNGSLDLTAKNFIVGANGSGKSTIGLAIELALLGYVPGYDKRADSIFQNSSGDSMTAGVVINGKNIVRTWTRGKTLKETIEIDGVTAGKQAAEAMITMAIGKEPVVVDIPALWAATGTERRRMILRMIGKEEEVNWLAKQEEVARYDKNEATRSRQHADATVEHLVKQLADTPRPTGNLAVLRQDLEKARTEAAELQLKIAQGKASDSLRAKIKDQAKMIPKIREEIESIKAKQDIVAAEIKDQAALLDGLANAMPVPPSDDHHETMTPDWVAAKIKSQLGVLQEAITMLMAMQGTGVIVQQITSVGKELFSLVPDREGWDIYKRDKAAWDTQHQDAVNQMGKLADIKVKLEYAQKYTHQQLKAAEQAESNINSIGPGLDPADEGIYNGICQRIAELEAKIKPLAEIETLEKSVESARVQAQAIIEKEEKAKDSLKAIIERQSKMIMDLNAILAERSENCLPDGIIVMEDDGRDLRLIWRRKDMADVCRDTLSGGEKCIYDAAVGHVLCPSAMVIIEGAEIDNNNLAKLFDRLADVPYQVCIMSCHDTVTSFPATWKKIALCG